MTTIAIEEQPAVSTTQADAPSERQPEISPAAYSVRAPGLSPMAFVAACAALWVAGGAVAMAAVDEPIGTLVNAIDR